METNLYRIDGQEETLYLPGGYAGLYLVMNQSNREHEFKSRNTDAHTFEELMKVDMENGASASHFRVVASFTFNFDILKSELWDRYTINWKYRIGGYSVLTAPNEFIARVLINICPYSKEEIYEMLLTTDNTMVFLMTQMLKDLSVKEAQEVVSMPTQVALSFPYYATRRYYRSTIFLLDNFPNLELNFCSLFHNSPGLVFKPLIERLLERGLNPFIAPKYGAIDPTFVNWYLYEYAFDAHEDLKDCRLKKEMYFRVDSFTQYKEEIERLEIYDKLVKKYVTGHGPDGTALTTTYTSWYDIECNESCTVCCNQAIPSMRHFFGQLIKKNKVLGHGGQGSVYECTWHGEKAAAKFIPNRGVHIAKTLQKAPEQLMDPMREKKMKQYFTSQASEFYIGRKIKHPHVLRMLDFFLQHKNGVDEFVIVSELCDATLSQIEFNMSSFMEYFRQVAGAIKSIGEKGLTHGDVKPENILLKKDDTGLLSTRLGDFGMAGIIGGTPLFVAPEVSRKSIPYLSDIYSLGISILVTVFEIQLAFKLYLVPVDNKILQVAKKKIQENELVRFIARMISDNPTKRPSIEEVEDFLGGQKYSEKNSERIITAKDLGINKHLQVIRRDSSDDVKRRADKFKQNPFSNVKIMNSLHHLSSYAELSKTTKAISKRVHDQGDSFKCWAFSTASMLRSSLRETIKALTNFSKEEKTELLAVIDDPSHHKTLRSELMMNVIPTKMNANEDEIQAAMLHHVMQRLSRPTLLQREGIHLLGSLKPIFDRLGQVQPVLEIYSHPSEYDQHAAELRQFGIIGDFFDALDYKKTLVCPVNTGLMNVKHAMCLYEFNENDHTFVFKNSSSEVTTITLPLGASEPRVGYHISFLRTSL